MSNSLTSPIAVTGATGALGQLVVSHLKDLGFAANTLALVRSPEKAAALGVAARKADYTQPETLTSALEGVKTLLLISSNEIGQRTAQHRAVLEAAKAAGVAHVVYTSLLHADRSPLNLAPEHVATEAALVELGLSHTILRNGWYTENYTASVPSALAHGAFVGSAGDGKISSAPRTDYALAAARVLTDASLQGKVYELASDTAYTLADFAAELSRQVGKEIPYSNLPEEDYANILRQAGLPEPLAAGLASWDAGASQGALFDDSKTLSALIGRPTTPLAEVIAQAL
jgi:NAD(P)H dehydrogenase (quinone)